MPMAAKTGNIVPLPPNSERAHRFVRRSFASFAWHGSSLTD
jgi:hypothetical protein